MWFDGPTQTPGVIQNAVINFVGSGDNTIIAGVAGLKIYIYRFYFIVGAATNITYKDGATALSGPLPFLANGFMILDPTMVPWHECAAGNNFVFNSSSAVQVSGSIGFIQSKAPS